MRFSICIKFSSPIRSSYLRMTLPISPIAQCHKRKPGSSIGMSKSFSHSRTVCVSELSPHWISCKINSVFASCKDCPESSLIQRPTGNIAQTPGFALWTPHFLPCKNGQRRFSPRGNSRTKGILEDSPIYTSQNLLIILGISMPSSFAIPKISFGVNRISSRLRQHAPHIVQWNLNGSSTPIFKLIVVFRYLL